MRLRTSSPSAVILALLSFLPPSFAADLTPLSKGRNVHLAMMNLFRAFLVDEPLAIKRLSKLLARFNPQPLVVFATAYLKLRARSVRCSLGGLPS